MPVLRIDDAEFEALPGETVREALERAGFMLGVCLGKGTCGGCVVTIDGKRALACKTVVTGDMRVTLADPDRSGGAAERTGGTVCLDLGSTVMKAALIDGGKVIACAQAVNPQTAFSSDVLRRTRAGQSLHALTAEGVNALIGRLTRSADRLVAVGNTVMLHLLLGADPSGMGQYPYTPAFLDARKVPGIAVGLHAGTVETLPCASAFIGADVTAGFTAYEMTEETALYIDLGTNGEIVLKRGAQLYGCSAAAGSAFGPQASDEIAELYERLERGTLTREGDAGTQAFQLAKAAIAAGIKTLCERAAVPFSRVRRVAIAGGIRVDPQAARAVGLIPAALPEAVCVGNRSLDGAVRAALDVRFAARVEATAKAMVTVLPTFDPGYQKTYVGCIPLGPV